MVKWKNHVKLFEKIFIICAYGLLIVNIIVVRVYLKVI